MMDAHTLRRRIYQTVLRLKRSVKRCLTFIPNSVSEDEQTILFILGCQRSGTTLLARIFDQDWRVRLFNEFDEISSDDREAGIRLNALPKVRETFIAQRFRRIVAKPIVESQRSSDLLEFFNNSKVVWLYRHFADVAASDLKKFGLRNGIENLRPIVNREADNWRAEGIEDSVWKTVYNRFSEEMNPYDAAALFWYCRNMCLFSAETGGKLNARIMLVPYELLVSNPLGTMSNIYNFVGWRFPGPGIVAEVDSDSVTMAHDRHLSPDVHKLCHSLLAQLDELAAYHRK